MRKADRIKGYLPYLAGGLYFLLLELIVTKLSIDVEKYLIYLVAIWGLITTGSVVVLEQGIDLFEDSHKNENEEG